MKKINLYILAALASMILNSCGKLVEVKPTSAIPAKEAIVDRNSAYSALRGMYSSLQSDGYYGQYMTVWPDLVADNLKHTGTFNTNQEADANRLLASNTTVHSIWGSIYVSISRANNLLKYIPQLTDVDSYEKADILGQAYFVRALGYFNLVRLFAGVPIILEPIEKPGDIGQPLRASVEDVYGQIYSDLDMALSMLPVPQNSSNIQNGLAGYYSALALKARVALQHADFSLAMVCADSVIKSNFYRLDDFYQENFDFQAPYSAESIFELDFTSQDGNALAFWFFYDLFGGRYEYAPTDGLVNAYDKENDQRFYTNLYHYADTSGTDLYMGVKYFDIATGSDNVCILRLAEMYLIRAEAFLHGVAYPGDPNTSAMDDVNTIRNRAGALPYDHEVSIDEVLNENRLEFAFEGHRWFDLIRNGKVADYVPTVVSANQLLWPIPQRERDVDPNLGQNTGY